MILRGDTSPLFSFIKILLLSNIKATLVKIIEHSIDDERLFFVDVVLTDRGPVRKILILADGDQGITIDQCATISRKVAAEIEAQNLIDHAFTLEVSSPGLDFPLKLQRQYVKNIGRQVKIKTLDGNEYTGTLSAVSEHEVTITPEPQKKGNKQPKKVNSEPAKSITLAFAAIDKTNVMISFK